MSEIEKLKHQERESIKSQLHVPMPRVLKNRLVWAVRELGWVSLAEWCRDAARRTIKEAERSANRSKDSSIGLEEQDHALKKKKAT